MSSKSYPFSPLALAFTMADLEYSPSALTEANRARFQKLCEYFSNPQFRQLHTSPVINNGPKFCEPERRIPRKLTRRQRRKIARGY